MSHLVKSSSSLLPSFTFIYECKCSYVSSTSNLHVRHTPRPLYFPYSFSAASLSLYVPFLSVASPQKLNYKPAVGKVGSIVSHVIDIWKRTLPLTSLDVECPVCVCLCVSVRVGECTCRLFIHLPLCDSKVTSKASRLCTPCH